ncbi:SDR family oxidoreductase [Nocardia sp. NPDC050406]|uniref:SDR family oxidoreductase n=1 Tax=Nocardia sp. NPDC050406 TaxID=3364318 RepID=UPI0037A4C68C
MRTVLITGGTGKLGRTVAARLDNGQSEVRVLSRRPAPGRVVGDLRRGTGLDAAVAGVDVVVHCATTYGRGDVAAARHLVDAIGRTGGRPHVVNVSIVGVDRIPLPYYRAKFAAEQTISTSGLPWTILRATQFHDLLATMFARPRWLPFTLAPAGFRFQPIDIRDVADRLAALATAEPLGRTVDLGGPQVRDVRELARVHHAITGRRRPVLSPRLPGAIARGYREGHHLAPENPGGTITFEQFLLDRTDSAS